MSKNHRDTSNTTHAATRNTENSGDHNNLGDSTNLQYEGIKRSVSLNDIPSLLWHDDVCRDKETEELGDSTNLQYEGKKRSLSLNDIPSLLWHDDVCRDKETEETSIIKKIKTNPIPESVIEGCSNMGSGKLPAVPEPFNLDEISRRTSIHFPGFKVGTTVKEVYNKLQLFLAIPLRIPPPLKPKPFSFAKRDEEMKRRREERIKKQLEEEQKQAYKFKARPIPGSVKKRMQIARLSGSSPASSENKENGIKVVKKTPTKPIPFQLRTEKRASERKSKKLKDKEEHQESPRQRRKK